MTEYGPLFELWFDGAKPLEAQRPPYDFKRFEALIRQHQPMAVTGIDGYRPDFRWVGNEKGYAPRTLWSFHPARTWPEGSWRPAECNTSIRNNWIWKPGQVPKRLDVLLDIYFTTQGRNCQLLLNIPPNPTGLFDEQDIARLYEFKAALDDIFDENLARFRPVTATHTRAHPEHVWAATQATNPSGTTFWAAPDSVFTATLEVDLEQTTSFNVIELKEPIAYGQRIAKHKIEAFVDEAWQHVASGTTVGYRRMHRVPVTGASKLRVVIEEALGPPALSKIGLYQSDYVPFNVQRDTTGTH